MDLLGVGMEEHIQASGGAAGPSQSQVNGTNTHLKSWTSVVIESILNTPTLTLHEAFTFQGNKGVEENNVRNQYSIPGILHFIQHEWARWIIVCLASKKILPCSPDLRWNDPNGRWKKLNSKLELLFSKVGFEISPTVSWMEQKKEKSSQIPLILNLTIFQARGKVRRT